MSPRAAIHLFGAYGIELEYMIVDRRTLSVLPIADRLLCDAKGAPTNECRHGPLSWSNELAAHLIEIKTTRPVRTLRGVESILHAGVRAINRRLRKHNAILMPGAAHPWMDPVRDCRLWPHNGGEIYRAFHRVFNCRGHGWVNLQSCHFNLPFRGAHEFGRLHAAIRILLPLLPALAASSPILEGRATGWLDTRMREYRNNCRRIPSVTASVVPEPVFTPRAYREEILAPMYRDIAPMDSTGLLQEEWLNARGAIARFERNTIEIRVLDVQECPLADCALLEFIAAVLKALVREQWSGRSAQQGAETAYLSDLLDRTSQIGGAAPIRNRDFATLFDQRDARTVHDLLRGLFERSKSALSAPHRRAISFILRHGTLAERIRTACGGRIEQNMRKIYATLCSCLETNRLFAP